jgi:hypothetical protein
MAKSKKVLKTDTFGTCSYEKTSPAAVTPTTSILNVILSFEEALKLNMAIDECVRALGRYNRAHQMGKRAALKVSIHLNQRRISVHEGKL